MVGCAKASATLPPVRMSAGLGAGRRSAHARAGEVAKLRRCKKLRNGRGSTGRVACIMGSRQCYQWQKGACFMYMSYPQSASHITPATRTMLFSALSPRGTRLVSPQPHKRASDSTPPQ